MSRAWAIPLGCVLFVVVWFSQAVLPVRQFWSGGQSVVWAAAGLLVLLASFDRGIVLPVPGVASVLEWLGSRSYGIYLINMTAKLLLHEAHQRKLGNDTMFALWHDDPLLWSGMVLATTLVLAEICYRLVEVPFMKLGNAVTADMLSSSPGKVDCSSRWVIPTEREHRSSTQR